jgi:hypothetical protein
MKRSGAVDNPLTPFYKGEFVVSPLTLKIYS